MAAKNKKILATRSATALVLVWALLALAGCAPVGPDYAAPAPDDPNQWNATLGDGLRPGPPDEQRLAVWWRQLGDPVLNDLVAQAVDGNLGLKEAKARVRAARARRGISQADLLPSLDASASAARMGTSDNGATPVGDRDLYKAGFDAGWELDVFGGARRGVEAAQADLEAAQADRDDVLVTLCAEVARNYLEVRIYQRRLDVAQANEKAQNETYQLIQSRFEAGLSDELASQQALYNLETTKSQIPALRAGLAQARHRLAVLLGRRPGDLDAILVKSEPIPAPPVTVAVGVPAEAMRRRPDIRAAERRLAAQTARVGEATAELYPKFRLAGSVGVESLKSHQLLEASSFLWSFIPSVSWRIFDGGAIRQNIEVQDATQEQYVYQYQAAVLGALEEVENALVSFVEEQYRRQRLWAAVAAAQRAESLSRDRYRAGLVDFSNVLEAQRSLLDLEDRLAQSEGAVTGQLIALYKALGGGWQPMTAEGKTM